MTSSYWPSDRAVAMPVTMMLFSSILIDRLSEVMVSPLRFNVREETSVLILSEKEKTSCFGAVRVRPISVIPVLISGAVRSIDQFFVYEAAPGVPEILVILVTSTEITFSPSCRASAMPDTLNRLLVSSTAVIDTLFRALPLIAINEAVRVSGAMAELNSSVMESVFSFISFASSGISVIAGESPALVQYTALPSLPLLPTVSAMPAVRTRSW